MQTLMWQVLAVGLAAGVGVAVLAGVLAWQLYRIQFSRQWARTVLLPSITAYTPAPSFTVGTSVPIHLHTTREATATLLRLGVNAVPVDWTRDVPITVQSSYYDFWHGLSWPVTLTIDTGALAPGLYLLHLEQKGDRSASFRVAFMLSPRNPPDVAVVLATNTWQAYNDFGGLSNYRDQVTPFPLRFVLPILSALNCRLQVGARHYVPTVPLPERRPNDCLNRDLALLQSCPTDRSSHVGRADWALVRFLEREAVPYALYSDRDFALGSGPRAPKLFMFGAHSEYWSDEMKGRLVSYVQSGGKVVFVSGNNTYQAVTFLEDALQVTDFRARPEEMARLTGLAYDARGYLTHAGFRVEAADHWVFDGLGVRRDDVFAEGADGHGASGFETDKLHPAGGPVTVLAVGRNREGPGFAILREHQHGGWIVNFGSVASAAWTIRDRVLGGMLRNVIARALQDEGGHGVPLKTPAQGDALLQPPSGSRALDERS